MLKNGCKNKYEESLFSRVADSVFAFLVLLGLSPFILVVSVLILLDGTGGPVLLLSPYRVGKNGRKFRMFKFRYMVPNAHSLIKNGKFGSKLKKKWEDGGGKLAINEDPRITKIGKLLRMTDFDEVPQFLNVIAGDMSVVGPRPYIDDEVEKYKKQYPSLRKCFDRILSVRPGITGLWQVSGRNSLSVRDRIKLDGECALKKSLLFDIAILSRTPWVVVTRKGAI